MKTIAEAFGGIENFIHYSYLMGAYMEYLKTQGVDINEDEPSYKLYKKVERLKNENYR